KVNLIMGDYFKAETIFMKYSKMALELITWLCSKTYVLAHLQEVQVASGKSPLTVICAVLTRWMAHYLAFSRLLELQHPIRALVNHNAMALPDQKIFTPSGMMAANKKKAHQMTSIIEDPSFWQSLAWCGLI
ncbi:hypothetical protein BJY52DRAFT_1129538, partial [Lactarius psammicola]